MIRFPLQKAPKKLKLTNSNPVCNARTRLSEFLPIPKCFVGKQITITVTVAVGAGVRTLEQRIQRIGYQKNLGTV